MNYNVPTEYQIQIETNKPIGRPKDVVIQDLINSLNANQIPKSCYFSAELVASNNYLALLDTIIRYYFQFIHCFNPNLIDYISQKMLLIDQIKKLYSGNLKNLCNNQEVRNHVCEMVSILCMVQKHEIVIPDQVQKITFHAPLVTGVNRVLSSFTGYLSKKSVIYQKLSLFAINYYHKRFDNCFCYVMWFVTDNEHTIQPFTEFKVSKTISRKSMWLIWKFLIIQYQKISEETQTLLETLIDLYVRVYRRKDYETCSRLICFVILLTATPNVIKWSTPVNLTHPMVIKQCAEINLVYAYIRQKQIEMDQTKIKSTKSSSSNGSKKTKKSRKAEKARIEFLAKPRNRNYMDLLNSDHLVGASVELLDETSSINSNHSNYTNISDSKETRFDGVDVADEIPEEILTIDFGET